MHPSSTPIQASGRRKVKEFKVLADCSQQSENSIKECPMEPVELEEIRNNPKKLDSMNVKELRTIARNIGVSTKGTKQDLKSSLKSLSFEGKITVSEGAELASTFENTDSKIDAQNLFSNQIPQIQHVISDITENKRRKVRTGRKIIGSTMTEDALKCPVDCEESPIEAEEVIVTEQSSSNVQSQQKVSIQMSLVAESNESWSMLAHKRPQKVWIPYNLRTMRPPPLNVDTKSMKLISWNVNGLRALLKLGSFSDQFSLQENFDVLCLQETKLQEKDVEAIKKNLIDGYDSSFWTCSVSKRGYSGTAIISRIKPISVTYGLGILDHDTEGRIVTVEFDKFYLINGYIPNSGDGLRRLAYRVEQWDPSLSNYMKELEKAKPVILTGDLNCAHEEIDIYDPVGNRRSAGFTNEERESFEKNFLSRGFVDTFRRQHPGVVAYTYWGYRHGGRKTNKGWRLDYFLASEIIADKVHDSYILPQIGGSDHCPIGLVLKL